MKTNLSSEDKKRLRIQAKNNVNKWRDKTGREKFKTRYKRLIDVGVPSYEANKMKYWSDKRIDDIINNINQE